jgi:hypothetical protein
MRKEYRKAVRAEFATRLAVVAPGFDPVKVSAAVLGGGESVFRWAPCGSLHTFVILVPSPTGHQAFTLEVAWSTAGRFPEVTARPSLVLGADDPLPIDVEEGILRIGDLGERRDVWWHLPDPAVERPGDLEALKRSLEPISPADATEVVRPRVEEAVDVLLRSAEPFLRDLAVRRCGYDVSPVGAS